MHRRLIHVLATQMFLVSSAHAGDKVDYLRLESLNQELNQIIAERFGDERLFVIRAATAKDVLGSHDIDAPDRDDVSIRSGVKLTALDWLSQFALQQSLFTAQDVLELRETITSLSEDDVSKWMNDTSALRAALSTSEWQSTNQWLSRFWEVQAIYDEGEVQAFRNRLKSLTANELLVVMDHLSTLYFSRVTRRQLATLARRDMPLLAPSRMARATISAVAPTTTSGPQIRSHRPPRLLQRDLSLRVRDWYLFRGLLFN